jgi:hypothetical protein
MNRILLVFVLCFVGIASHGYNVNGERWVEPYRYSVSSSCTGVFELVYNSAVEKAFPFDYEVLDDVEHGWSADGHSTVVCSDTPPPAELRVDFFYRVREYTEYNEQGQVVGKARWRWNDNNLAIFECDVWLRSDQNLFQLFVTAPHEVLHCAGFGHTDDPNALMAPTAMTSNLQVDDWLGVADLYGDCGTLVDENGDAYIPRLNVDRYLRSTMIELDEDYSGQEVAVVIRDGFEWPLGVEVVRLSQCD